MTLIDKAEAHDDDLIRRVAAAMWNAETIDAGVPKSVTDARTPEAFAEQSDFIRAKWMKLARAAIAALPARGVGVKPLVWGAYPIERFAGPDVAVADAPFNHRYQVQRDPWAQGYMAFLHPILPITSSCLWWESKGHPTLEAAKAAAQADYEAHVLAALTTEANHE